MVRRRGWVSGGLALLLAGALVVWWELASRRATVEPPELTEYRRVSAPASTTPPRAGGGVSLDLVGSGLSGFNPAVAQGEGTQQLLRLLHAGLVEQEVSSAELVPALASSWQVEGGTSYTFTVRRGVRWSDGEPFDAADVVFTFRDVVFNPDIDSPWRELFLIAGQLPRVEALDAHTVRFVTPAVFAPFLRWLSFVPLLPRHRLAAHVARLHPPGARQALSQAKVIVQTIFQKRSAAWVGAKRYGALAAGLAELGTALDGRALGPTQSALAALEDTLADVEADLPKGSQAQALSPDELYLVSLLGFSIVNLRRTLDQLGQQARQGNYDALGMREDTFERAWSLDAPPAELAGLGPFRVRGHPGDELVLERNPYYWKRDERGVVLPYLDELRVRFVPDAQQALVDFGTRRAQLFLPRSQDLPLLRGQTGTFRPGQPFSLRLNPSFGTNFVVFNQDSGDPGLKAAFRDLRFRRAVAHALDRGTLIDEVFHGAGVALDGPVCPASPFHAAGLPRLDYDLAAAAELLEAAGLRDRDGDGRREDRQGRPLSFELITNRDNPLRVRTAELLRGALGHLGVQVRLKLVGFDFLLQKVLGGSFQAAVLGLTGGVDPQGGVQMWRLDGSLRLWRPRSQPEGWETRVDELFQRAAATLEDAERRALYAEFQRLVVEHLPVIYTVAPRLALAYDRSLGNADLANALGTPLSIAEWLFLRAPGA